MTTDGTGTPNVATTLLELVGASIAMPDPDAYAEYVQARFREILKDATPSFLMHLLIGAVAMTGQSVRSWAEDTERAPEELLLAVYNHNAKLK